MESNTLKLGILYMDDSQHRLLLHNTQANKNYKLFITNAHKYGLS